jgi:hypothetical protein
VLIPFLEITLSQKVEGLMKIHAGKRLRPRGKERRSHPLAGAHTPSHVHSGLEGLKFIWRNKKERGESGSSRCVLRNPPCVGRERLQKLKGARIQDEAYYQELSRCPSSNHITA